MSTFNIRNALPEDTALLYRFIMELARYEKMEDCVETNEEILHDSLFVRNAAKALIAEEDGIPVGYAIYFNNFSTFTGRPGIYLEDIYITPAVRGKGYGRAIFNYLARVAEETGCARMEWACLDWNTPSLQFYAGLGAKGMTSWVLHRLSRDGICRLADRQENKCPL